MSPVRLLSAVLLVSILTSTTTPARGGTLTANASNPDASTIMVSWTFSEDPDHPSGHPEWVGFDIVRRPAESCEGDVRLNEQPFPRTLNESTSGSFTDPSPAQHKLFRYDVIPVDANRNPVDLGGDCRACSGSAWASSPASSAPVIGTLTDIGWTLTVTPCQSTCYPALYIEQCCSDQLRSLADGVTPVALYGATVCGSVEGCAITVDQFLVSTCSPPLETRARTWGGLKQLYR